MFGGVFEASNDGTTYTAVAVISTRVGEGWSYIDVPRPVNATHRYFRYRSSSPSLVCEVNELQFVGYRMSTSFSGSCAVNVTVGPLAATFTAVSAAVNTSASSPMKYQYDVTSTPVVTDVFPDFGSSLGGTLLNVSGSGFGASTNASNVTVVVNGVLCTVTAVSDTSIMCITGARPPPPDIPPVSLSVVVNGLGSAVFASDRRTYFRYLDRWSDLRTWRYNEPPIEGDFVVVPPHQTLLMDVSPPELFVLLVQGSLVFDRQDLALDAWYILVEGGTFEIGSEEKPFLNKATITVHGDRYANIALPDVGAKCFAAYMVETMAAEVSGAGSAGILMPSMGVPMPQSVLGTCLTRIHTLSV